MLVELADVQDALAQIDGVSDIEEEPSENPEYRVFWFSVDQRVFHEESTSRVFKQRVRLMFKGSLAPTVLALRDTPINEMIQGKLKQTEIASSQGANEIAVQLRDFVDPLVNSDGRFGGLLSESATDLHHIVEKLRPLLWGSWTSTGRGHAGTVAVSHRRFYPLDTQATIAFSAPFHFGLYDTRLQDFLETVGTKNCRERVIEYQKRLLALRDKLGDAFYTEFSGRQPDFDLWPGGLLQSYEYAVHNLGALMWQFYGAQISKEECANIPDRDSDDQTATRYPPFFRAIGGGTHHVLYPMLGHHLHTRTELGYPKHGPKELEAMYEFDVHDFRPYLLGQSSGNYDESVMLDTYVWSSVAMNRLILLYGEYDPFRAAALELSDARMGEAYSFVVPGQDYGLSLGTLTNEQFETVQEAMTRWTGAPMAKEIPFSGR